MEKKLSKGAYGGIKGSEYRPYVENGNKIKQTTKATLIIGIVLSLIFAASNTYAGMLSGLTVAAGIPGSIIGASLMAIFAKQNKSILNSTIIQGMASGGESIASGMIYVLPAIFIIGGTVNFFQGIILGFTGVLLGVGVTSIVYNYLIIEEHGKLIYPEAMAISETLVVSEEKGEGLKIMSIGAGIAFVFTLISAQITNLFSTTVAFVGTKFKYQFQTDVNPLLLGIGFIVGMDVALAMFAGAVLGNIVMTPLIGYFSGFAADGINVWNNPDIALNTMGADEIRNGFIKYIGAGMMLCGGIIGAIKLIPVIIESISSVFGTKTKTVSVNSNQQNTTFTIFILGLIAVFISVFMASNNDLIMIVTGILLVVFFIILFAIVSAKMTGDIGTSNLPVSGMTISALLVITLIFLALGYSSPENNKTVLMLGTMVAVGISAAGGYAQSQKVSYIIGGSADKMQKSYVIAGLVGVIGTVGTIVLLKPQILSGTLEAPQANLMATLTQGILDQNLPWTIIGVGVLLSLVLFFLDLPIMTIAIGFYLPMGTVSIILIGALIRLILEKTAKKDELESRRDRGVILASGLVAGGALTGLLGAIIATSYGTIENFPLYFSSENGALISGNAVALVMLIALILVTMYPIFKMKVKKNND